MPRSSLEKMLLERMGGRRLVVEVVAAVDVDADLVKGDAVALGRRRAADQVRAFDHHARELVAEVELARHVSPDVVALHDVPRRRVVDLSETDNGDAVAAVGRNNVARAGGRAADDVVRPEDGDARRCVAERGRAGGRRADEVAGNVLPPDAGA
jgi:hypothetical protein